MKSFVQLIINITLCEDLRKDEKLVKHVSGEGRFRGFRDLVVVAMLIGSL